jgi:hypothetical protein
MRLLHEYSFSAKNELFGCARPSVTGWPPVISAPDELLGALANASDQADVSVIAQVEIELWQANDVRLALRGCGMRCQMHLFLKEDWGPFSLPSRGPSSFVLDLDTCTAEDVGNAVGNMRFRNRPTCVVRIMIDTQMLLAIRATARAMAEKAWLLGFTAMFRHSIPTDIMQDVLALVKKP